MWLSVTHETQDTKLESAREVKTGGILIPFTILEDANLTSCEKILYSYIFSFQANGGRCWQSSQALADRIGFDIRSIKRAMTKLLREGYIIRVGWAYEGLPRVAFECVLERGKMSPKGQNVPSPVTKCPSRGDKMSQTEGQNVTYNNDLNNHLITSEYEQPPVLEKVKSKFLEIAEKQLLEATDPGIQSSNQFIIGGRRPLKKYPNIWLTPSGLADVFEQYEAAGIPIDGDKKYLPAFKSVNERIEQYRIQGKPLEGVSAHIWLTSWALRDLQQTIISANRLSTSENYKRKAAS